MTTDLPLTAVPRTENESNHAQRSTNAIRLTIATSGRRRLGRRGHARVDPPGCGDDTGTTTGADEAALITATDALADACVDRDRGRLRDLTGVGTQDRLRDQDQVFNEGIESVVVLSRDIDGDTAVILVTLDVTINGETTEIERGWEYEKVDGVWVLSTVPDCIFS